jgi:predicted RNA-binding Zn ribbon-like protein
MSEDADDGRAGPGQVALVTGFLNTVDLESVGDPWTEPGGLVDWLRDHGGPAEPTDDDLALAVDLREGLRAAVSDACGLGAGEPPDPEPLGRALRRLPVVLGADLAVRPAPGLTLARSALAEVVTAVLEAQAAGTWDRVKVCARDTCRWAFWDGSRNRSSAWCSMRVCGNREKMRRRARRETPAG